MNPYATIVFGRQTRLVVLMLTLTVSPGCAWFSEQHASLIHARVSAENVKAGRNSHLQIGMPIREAADYLESCDFHREHRGDLTPSRLSAGKETALHYVRQWPHSWAHFEDRDEVHVLLIHDGQHLIDIKSETANSTTD